jgi:UDP-N-acetylmuramate dehydrogenase
MKVVENPSLKAFNTFGTEARAALAFTLESEEDVLSLPGFNPATDVILGGGSNVLFVDDVPGSVILNRILGISLIEESDGQVIIEAGAGENWHGLVLWTLAQGYCGLENLSLIPGLAGAAPIQNIGAYGVELSSVLEGVTCWDWKQSCWRSLQAEECLLGYRDSRFKSADPDRFLISSIRLRLSREFIPRLSYAGLQEELSIAGIGQASARDVSDAIIRIRSRKLPDPAVLGNAGSFFKNPAIRRENAESLIERFPGLPSWEADAGLLKLSAAWMIEHCGLKAYRKGDAGISGQHALVLVNHGAASGREIAEMADIVRSAVEDAFGVRLETEPRLIEFTH